ncbi:alpha/beta hydrolase [Arenibacter troitsensis]|uniref:S-formylglutathione hydrolase FrmB n=1 Tax=Arenibacter troitsensis TaxID=188872 RepID=A0A1X7KC06_9FLAO|nr:alpha/beta hydrolase-fold protein [Arenibacter troitsensis]SMG37906.1 S-formylglutathione hydrolase FrmB [Arenibacter troitsensis]
MRNNPIFLCMLMCLAVSNAQTGKVFDALTMKSEILKSERKFAVYLPPDYETSNRSYPVLYLLHGAGDDQTGWVQFGEVLRIADNAIKEGKATPMVIIMPDANTGTRGYFNSIKGDWRYEDFFFEELMPFVEKKYRIKGEKRFRAIAGLSMGGGGSFMYALRHPELFSSACPLSAYIGALSLDDFRQRLKSNNESYEDGLVSAYYEKHNALSLIQASSLEDLKSVRWYIDCGDDDFLYEGNSLVHIAMKKKEVPHEYRVREGRHSWTYWRESLPAVLEFVSDAFHQY